MPSVSRIQGESTSKSFVYMWIGARHMLRLAKESQDGQLYTCLSCMVLTAFMLEAYFNHLGQLKHADWEKIERKLSKAKKFTKLANAAGLEPKMNDRPYSSLLRVFAFRDAMAHARTMKEQIDVEVELGDSIAKSLPGPEWQEMITVENAEEILEDAVSIIRELHKAAGYIDDPFATGGGGVYVARRGDK
jgi:hypothetical protein